MRDFRDAKAMAQTLRESLNTKSVSITHSESLELIARILGCQDWNVLSARIHAENGNVAREPEKATRSTAPLAEKRPEGQSVSQELQQEIALDAMTLDRLVGFYQFNDDQVLTVTRDANHLVTQLIGQPPVPIYPRGDTKFFGKLVDVEYTFVIGTGGQATSLVLRQGGHEFPMSRVDAATAQEIESRLKEKFNNQLPNPGSEAAIRRLIDGLVTGTPNYHEMVPALAEATRQQLPQLRANQEEIGPILSIKFLGVGREGEDVYTVNHEHGPSHWRIKLNAKGKIAMAWVTPGP